MEDEDASTGPYTKVLLVCVYNKCSNVITHDMLYEIFAPYGLVQRILIFVKAKVWKAFIEMDNLDNAKYAADKLNNTVIFQDGSKMIIYPSKLQMINFQNGNNGGVDYQELRKISELIPQSGSEAESYHSADIPGYYSWSDVVKSEPVLGKETFSTGESHFKTNVSVGQMNEKQQEDDWFSPSRIRKRESTWNNCWYDIQSQFEELALESSQYRAMRMSACRPKSNTVVPPFNPKQQQYLLDNLTSKVLFIRSIMPYYTIKFIYNILYNFGNIIRIVHMVQKQSFLAQFQHIQDATQAKDFLNLVKNSIKIFFSHYQTLQGRQINQSQQIQQYTLTSPKRDHFNPPSETLHISYISQTNQQQLLQLIKQYGVVSVMKWQKHQNNNKPMLLVKMSNMQQSMKVMGFLQNKKIGNKFIKISFTRSKLSEEKMGGGT